MTSKTDKGDCIKPTASIPTLGCKVNQFESAAMTRLLNEAGYDIVPPGRAADLTVINSCTVTHKADLEVKALIRKAIRLNPDGRIVVTGCLAQSRPEEISSLPGVDLVLGNNYKFELMEYLGSSNSGDVHVSPPGRNPLNERYFPEFERTRSFLRIQDGCSAACSYCAIPRARGPSRSLPREIVEEGFEYYEAAGYEEIVLTGIHLGAWGLDLKPPSDFTSLIRYLIERESAMRIRLSSIEPNEVTDELAQMAGSRSRLCPYFHLALQSGSDKILSAMRRPYTTGLFENLVHKLNSYDEFMCIGADVLVGFPGEDEDAFMETRDLLARLPLSYFHVFPFSKRPRTPAFHLPDQTTEEEKKKRTAELRKLGQEKRSAFIEKNLGQVRQTLVENTKDKATGFSRGLTDNYITVLLPDSDPPPARIIPVRVVEPAGGARAIGKAV